MGLFGPSREEKAAERRQYIQNYYNSVKRVKVLGTTGITTTYQQAEGTKTTNIWITLLVEKMDGRREIISDTEDDDLIVALMYKVDMNN